MRPAALFSGGAAAALKGADATVAATRAAEAFKTAATFARDLRAALKNTKIRMVVTPEGVRLPAGIDTTELHKLISQANKGDGPGTAGAGLSTHNATDLPDLTLSRAQLEAKFKHAADFGVAQPRGADGFAAYSKAVDEVIRGSSTVRIQGTYRGQPVILNYNEASRLVVVQAPNGTFMSGWKMSEAQLRNVMTKGSLGGG